MRASDTDFRSAIKAHGGRVERFRRGEFTGAEFTPIRLGYGLYYQLDHTSHMQRIKLPGGILTAAQADCLADIAAEYGRGVAHVTTRQDIQIHWVPLESVVSIYERLHEVGISTRGACGDSIRNVTGCYHAGTLADEPFDITPYVYAVHEYSLFHPLNLTLPRKFKISFSSCGEDCVQGRVNDIAFFPRRRDGQIGFRVHAGGGLGSQPFLAVPVADFVTADEVLVITETIVRLQHHLGERKNRKRARMKYLAQRLGAEGFVQGIEAERKRVEAECGEQLRQELREIASSFRLPEAGQPGSELPSHDGAMAHWARTNVRAQRQAGYYGVTVQLPLGDCTPRQLHALADLAREHGSGVLRTTNDQNLYLPWIPGARVAVVYERLTELRLADADALHISDVVSCPGADYCSLAMSRSMGVASSIRKHLLSQNGDVEKLGVFRIRISGCPNACGQHYVGDIGLTGQTLKSKDGGESPHYSIMVGGSVGEDDAALGQRITGRFPEAEVPHVIASLAKFYGENRQDGEVFRHFVSRIGTKRLSEVAQAASPGVR